VIYVFSKQVAGELAKWAIRQSPYSCPDNLESVVTRFVELFPKSDDASLRQLDMIAFDEQGELYDAVQATSEQIPELLAWNTRKNGNDAPLGFCSRYSRPDPDDDFIDLHALWGNVARTIFCEERDRAEAA
jgi:hypothetical protein